MRIWEKCANIPGYNLEVVSVILGLNWGIMPS